jgi:hypothetical protein
MQLLLVLIWTSNDDLHHDGFSYGVYVSSCLGLAWTSCTLLVSTRRGAMFYGGFHSHAADCSVHAFSKRPRTRTLVWVSDPMVHGHLKSGAHRGPSAQLFAINNYLSR